MLIRRNEVVLETEDFFKILGISETDTISEIIVVQKLEDLRKNAAERCTQVSIGPYSHIITGKTLIEKCNNLYYLILRKSWELFPKIFLIYKLLFYIEFFNLAFQNTMSDYKRVDLMNFAALNIIKTILDLSSYNKPFIKEGGKIKGGGLPRFLLLLLLAFLAFIYAQTNYRELNDSQLEEKCRELKGGFDYFQTKLHSDKSDLISRWLFFNKPHSNPKTLEFFTELSNLNEVKSDFFACRNEMNIRVLTKTIWEGGNLDEPYASLQTLISTSLAGTFNPALVLALSRGIPGALQGTIDNQFIEGDITYDRNTLLSKSNLWTLIKKIADNVNNSPQFQAVLNGFEVEAKAQGLLTEEGKDLAEVFAMNQARVATYEGIDMVLDFLPFGFADRVKSLYYSNMGTSLKMLIGTPSTISFGTRQTFKILGLMANTMATLTSEVETYHESLHTGINLVNEAMGSDSIAIKTAKITSAAISEKLKKHDDANIIKQLYNHFLPGQPVPKELKISEIVKLHDKARFDIIYAQQLLDSSTKLTKPEIKEIRKKLKIANEMYDLLCETVYHNIGEFEYEKINVLPESFGIEFTGVEAEFMALLLEAFSRIHKYIDSGVFSSFLSGASQGPGRALGETKGNIEIAVNSVRDTANSVTNSANSVRDTANSVRDTANSFRYTANVVSDDLNDNSRNMHMDINEFNRVPRTQEELYKFNIYLEKNYPQIFKGQQNKGGSRKKRSNQFRKSKKSKKNIRKRNTFRNRR